jgi:hypothetical protein
LKDDSRIVDDDLDRDSVGRKSKLDRSSLVVELEFEFEFEAVGETPASRSCAAN